MGAGRRELGPGIQMCHRKEGSKIGAARVSPGSFSYHVCPPFFGFATLFRRVEMGTKTTTFFLGVPRIRHARREEIGLFLPVIQIPAVCETRD